MARKETPFFASIGFFETHRPFNEPGCDNDSPGDVTPLPWLPDRPGIREDIAGLNGLCYEVDRCVGTIVEGLDADPAHAGIRNDLRGRVSDWMESTGDRLLAGDWPAPKEQLARLESNPQPN